MASFRDLLAATKASIREVDTAEADELRTPRARSLLDVREPDEYEQGAVPGSMHIPRGTSRANIEGRMPDTVHAARRDVRRRRALGLRGQDPPRARLHDVVSVMPAASTSGRTRAATGRSPPPSPPSSATATAPPAAARGRSRAASRSCSDAKVLLLGAGGLGSPAALYLAAAGVGTLGIVDMDVVDESNLQRQILHNMDRIGERKVDSAKKTLTLLNPDVNVVTHDVRLDASNVESIIEGYDVVVDGADNFPTRYMLNDASVKLGIPVVHGSIFRFEGRSPSSTRRTAPPTATCSPSRPRRARPELRRGRRARRAARHRRQHPGDRDHQADPRPGRPAVGRLLAYDSLEQSFREYKVQVDPTNEITHANADRIVVAELDGLCAPLPLQPPPG
jgi:hypothetical protein